MCVDWKITWIIVHPKERRDKCTVEPLRHDRRFAFCRYPQRPPSVEGYVRLSLEGPILSRSDAAQGLVILDGTWRWARVMEKSYCDIPPRTLPRLQTAYPRRSKLFPDPDEGLATIEALYVAWWLQGRDVSGLLDRYPWGEDFLHKNAAFFAGGQRE
ncbi:MAG: hypothetical protein KatS3mg113_0902 [Planctomycetaceae bacterium]|nr:MAG: hypothetical protein KatS3mg113_0902 [Planctomycetaceae bacterium]